MYAEILSAQSTVGLTNQPDTSYTTFSAYTSTKKKYPEISIATVAASSLRIEKKDLVYCSINNRKLVMDAFYPKQKVKGKRPAIMIIHGGGWRSGNRTQHYPLAQRLADLGYVCFTPEYRLSTEALFPAAVYDLKAALRYIHAKAKDFNIDTNKIAVLGFSSGGELAAFLATTLGNSKYEGKDCYTKYSSRVQALVDLDGTLSFVHPESGEGDDSKKISAATYWFGYSKKDNYELWKEASPLSHVGKNTPPVLFINSGVDRMHAGRNDLIEELKKYGINAEIKTFEGSPHSFPLFNPWFEPTIQYADEFLKKTFRLKN